MKARLIEYKEIRITCPHCGVDDNRIDHLFTEELPYQFGPWYCDDCVAAYSGTINSPTDIDLSLGDIRSDHVVKTLNLLRIDGLSGPIWLVVKGIAIRGLNWDRLREQSRTQFYYDEHTCPTNWTGDIVAVIEDGNADPHGFASFVRCVDIPTGFNEDNADWSVLFPEAFQTDPYPHK